MKILLFVTILFGCTHALAAETVPRIACNLKALTPEQRKQLGQIGRHVISAISTSRELNDGYAFGIEPAKASVVDVARWLHLWRRCCPFYEFQIDFHAADGTVWLSVKGRPGVKEYIKVDSPELAAKLHD
jgi:hypothetical protein